MPVIQSVKIAGLCGNSCKHGSCSVRVDAKLDVQGMNDLRGTVLPDDAEEIVEVERFGERGHGAERECTRFRVNCG